MGALNRLCRDNLSAGPASIGEGTQSNSNSPNFFQQRSPGTAHSRDKRRSCCPTGKRDEGHLPGDLVLSWTLPSFEDALATQAGRGASIALSCLRYDALPAACTSRAHVIGCRILRAVALFDGHQVINAVQYLSGYCVEGH